MTNTERKLDEARYFLKQLDSKDPYFDYILSAYLNAARSTFWIMRYEFGKLEGWTEWFEFCDVTNEQKKLLDRINELRIESTKRSGVKTDYFFLENLLVDEKYYPVIKKFFSDLPPNTDLELEILPLDEAKAPLKDSDEDTCRFQCMLKINDVEAETSREMISKLCIDYFNFLESHVKVCTERFG